MRRSLFVKIYLTLLASLVIVAITSAIFVRLGQNEEDLNWADRRDLFVEAMFPSGDDADTIRIVIDRLSVAFDADITLFDAERRVIAAAGTPLTPDVLDGRHGRRSGERHAFVVPLSGGRHVAARMDMPFGPAGGRRNVLGYLALIAAVTGLAAYPVVRHLHRRLDGLRAGVTAWGEGALSLRVPTGGRDEVTAVAVAFNLAADRVEKLIQSHRSLLANASHELRSPLARLRMAADLYGQTPSEATHAEIVRNLEELDALVEEILLASRLDHAGKPDRSESVDLLALAAEEGARHGVDVTGEALRVEGDRRLLTRLVRNLIQNAERHGAPPVTVTVARTGGSIELAVRDHGPGIPAGEGDRVFEPFYRPAGSSETGGGWGLGLSLVRQIARSHGATVRHDTPEGGGARFVVSFGQ